MANALQTLLGRQLGVAKLIQERVAGRTAALPAILPGSNDGQGNELVTSAKLAGPVYSVPFDPDGKRLAVGLGNGTAMIVNLP